MWLKFIGFGATTAFAPLAFLNGSYVPVYQHYFSTGSGETESVYIGRRAVLSMNFAGYRLDYLNKDSSVFDNNYRALPTEFMNLYGHLLIHKPDELDDDTVVSQYELSVPLQLILVIKQIVLKEYDRLMKQDHTRPLDHLVTAVKDSLEKQEDTPLVESTASTASSESTESKIKFNSLTVYDSYNYPFIIYYSLQQIDDFKVSLQNKSPELYEFLAETR